MPRHNSLDMFVLDVVSNDLEAIDDVMRMLNRPDHLGWARERGGAFSREEVLGALVRLVREDAVRVVAAEGDGLVEMPPGTFPEWRMKDCYFRITSKGKMRHQNWKPPK